MPQSDHLVQDAAEGPNVGLLVIRLFLANFRRQVVRRPNGSLRAIVGVLKHARNSKVANLYLAILGHEYVLSF